MSWTIHFEGKVTLLVMIHFNQSIPAPLTYSFCSAKWDLASRENLSGIFTIFGRGRMFGDMKKEPHHLQWVNQTIKILAFYCSRNRFSTFWFQPDWSKWKKGKVETSSCPQPKTNRVMISKMRNCHWNLENFPGKEEELIKDKLMAEHIFWFFCVENHLQVEIDLLFLNNGFVIHCVSIEVKKNPFLILIEECLKIDFVRKCDV